MMFGQRNASGFRFPPAPMAVADDVAVVLTDEAAITSMPGEELRVEPLVAEDDLVAQGQPVFRLRADPRIALTAPIAGRVARIELAPGRKLSQLVLFREGEERYSHTRQTRNEVELRSLLQGSGWWRTLRSRPFGRMPAGDERPAAIFIMATDTRPEAPDPQMALAGREDDFAAGLKALARLTSGTLWLCLPDSVEQAVAEGVRQIRCARLHPQGLAGIQIHHWHPARIDAPVWDIHAEDVADLGTLLTTGLLPETRLISVSGEALQEHRLLRCSPGSDLRALVHGLVRPGPHQLLTGPALQGQAAHWLGARDRQLSVPPGAASAAHRHWFSAALRRAARPMPVIPTAALNQAMGGDIPGVALIRALASGDSETAVRLGALSLLEEDLALTDYITGAQPAVSWQLRAMLDGIEAEEALA